MTTKEEILALAGELKDGSNWLGGKHNIYSYNRSPKQAAAMLEVLAEISIDDLIAALRAPEAWRIEGYGHFKDATSNPSDAPFLAADVIESFYHAARKPLEEEIERLNGLLSVHRLSFAEMKRQRNVEMESATKWANGYHELRQQLAEKDAEIARLQYSNDVLEVEKDLIKDEIAAGQAREQQLRGAIAMQVSRDAAARHNIAMEALALPQDTTALESMIAKAGEVMRHRCLYEADIAYHNKHCCEEIRALTGVTISDLKGGV